VAQLSTLGTLALEHETNPKHSVHVTGGRPEGYAGCFYRDYDFVRHFLRCTFDVSCDAAEIFGHGYIFRFHSTHHISVGALLSRAAPATSVQMRYLISALSRVPNKSPEPTAVGAVSSAVAVHAASRRWLSFFR